MGNVLWEPSEYHYNSSNIAKFISFVNTNYQQNIINYDDLYQWSITDISNFWESIS